MSYTDIYEEENKENSMKSDYVRVTAQWQAILFSIRDTTHFQQYKGTRTFSAKRVS